MLKKLLPIRDGYKIGWHIDTHLCTYLTNCTIKDIMKNSKNQTTIRLYKFSASTHELQMSVTYPKPYLELNIYNG